MICPRQPTALPIMGRVIPANKLGERGLAMEPLYQGEPILAVAAVDELTAAEAIEKIKIDFEPLPFVVDPLETLRPGGPNARTQGNVWVHRRPAAPPVDARRSSGPDGRKRSNGPKRFRRSQSKAVCRWAKPTDEWSYGDLDRRVQECGAGSG